MAILGIFGRFLVLFEQNGCLAQGIACPNPYNQKVN
jgi:hypothetical protein